MSGSLSSQPSDASDPSLQTQQELKGDRNQAIGHSVNSTVVSGQVVNLTVYDRPPILRGQLPASPVQPPDNLDYRFQKVLLNKVNKYWIQGVLEKSLYNQALIELRLEERLDAVKDPFNSFQALPDESRKTPLDDRDIYDVFFEMGEGRTLLILGEPGAGKTITLLRLTKDLITRAEEDLNYPIPVVFNLSSWIYKRQTITNWLIGELDSKYQVSRKLGKKWITNQRLLLLLDGLDEVKVDYREECVQAINQFMQQYGQTEMVVCSRLKDYKVLSNRLNLQSAIYLQPLSIEQVDQYFSKAGNQLKTLRTLFQKDIILQELAKSPLMLSVMSLAYQDESSKERIEASSVEEYHQKLFNAYIKQMLRRWRVVEPKYSKEKFMGWLTNLALRMSQESQTIFLIEQLQPTYLGNRKLIIAYKVKLLSISGLVGGIAGCLSLGLVGGLVVQNNVLAWKLTDGLFWVPVGALTGTLLGTLILGLSRVNIEAVETLSFSWKGIIQHLISSSTVPRALLFSLVFTLLMGLRSVFLMSDKSIQHSLGDNLVLTPEHRVSFAIISSFTFALSFGIVLGVINSLKGSNIEIKAIPNQGIWRSATNASLMGLIAGLIGLFIGGITGGLIGKAYFGSVPNSVINIGLIYSLLYGVAFGLVGGLFNSASTACVQHFTLRLSLYLKGFFPWNLSRFLNYATDHLFLQKVGGGYIFIHRMLLEHLAKQSK
ncbi:NACHT domain-containing protein [Argonema antarcticum]|uniref:NACHT domain-containing protein n=1 Tax=Argonema antarcticum TaxID=2942763 RepID=UPI002011E117|nr:NACHT domain-containing protein [Argonema antarcticum]MCL1469687.1 NACHT domain-containing protein [Argonema antarcticum A004/B2]